MEKYYLKDTTLHSQTLATQNNPKPKSKMVLGDIIIYNTNTFNWFQRKMWKIFFGFEIKNIKE